MIKYITPILLIVLFSCGSSRKFTKISYNFQAKEFGYGNVSLVLYPKKSKFVSISNFKTSLSKREEKITGKYTITEKKEIVFRFQTDSLLLNPLFDCKNIKSINNTCIDTLYYMEDSIMTKYRLPQETITVKRTK